MRVLRKSKHVRHKTIATWEIKKKNSETEICLPHSALPNFFWDSRIISSLRWRRLNNLSSWNSPFIRRSKISGAWPLPSPTSVFSSSCYKGKPRCSGWKYFLSVESYTRIYCSAVFCHQKFCLSKNYRPTRILLSAKSAERKTHRGA